MADDGKAHNKWLTLNVVGQGTIHLQVSQIIWVKAGRGGTIIRTADGEEWKTDEPTGHLLAHRIEAKLI